MKREMTAAEMATIGAKKELEGYSDAFAIRDRIRAQESLAARQRELARAQRKGA